MVHETAFRNGGSQRAVRRRRDARSRDGAGRSRRAHGAGRHRSQVARLAPVQTALAALDEAHEGGALRPGTRGADRRLLPRRDRLCGGSLHRRDRGRRRRLRHRHSQGGEPLHDLSPGRLPGLRERADRQGDAGARPAQAADRRPTTAGTGSETTGVSIFDLTEMHAKTGIASRRLKPTLGILDPENTKTMPPQVAARVGSTSSATRSSRSRLPYYLASASRTSIPPSCALRRQS